MTGFAIFIKSLHVNKGLTQTQFAAKLNIDTAALEFNLDIDDIKAKYFSEKIA